MIRQVTALGLGGLISAYYWLPVMLEKNLIQESSPFNFYDHFPFIKQLIYSPWAYGASLPGPGDYISFQIGVANWLVLAAAIFGLIFWLKQITERRQQFLLVGLLVATGLVLVLMNIRSSFFWQVFPFTQLVQFPWRLLMLTTFLIPLLLALISKEFKGVWSGWLMIIVLALSLYPNVTYFQPGEVFKRDDAYFLNRFLPGSEEYLKHTEDYVSLPKGAVRPTQSPESKVTAIRKMMVSVVDDNPYDYQFIVTQPQAQTVLFHTFYFPGWQVWVDDEKKVIEKDEKGYITFEVPEGRHEVEIKYTDSTVREWADLISLLTVIGLLEWYLIDSLYENKDHA